MYSVVMHSEGEIENVDVVEPQLHRAPIGSVSSRCTTHPRTRRAPDSPGNHLSPACKCRQHRKVWGCPWCSCHLLAACCSNARRLHVLDMCIQERQRTKNPSESRACGEQGQTRHSLIYIIRRAHRWRSAAIPQGTCDKNIPSHVTNGK